MAIFEKREDKDFKIIPKQKRHLPNPNSLNVRLGKTRFSQKRVKRRKQYLLARLDQILVNRQRKKAQEIKKNTRAKPQTYPDELEFGLLGVNSPPNVDEKNIQEAQIALPFNEQSSTKPSLFSSSIANDYDYLLTENTIELPSQEGSFFDEPEKKIKTITPNQKELHKIDSSTTITKLKKSKNKNYRLNADEPSSIPAPSSSFKNSYDEPYFAKFLQKSQPLAKKSFHFDTKKIRNYFYRNFLYILIWCFMVMTAIIYSPDLPKPAIKVGNYYVMPSR